MKAAQRIISLPKGREAARSSVRCPAGSDIVTVSNRFTVLLTRRCRSLLQFSISPSTPDHRLSIYITSDLCCLSFYRLCERWMSVVFQMYCVNSTSAKIMQNNNNNMHHIHMIYSFPKGGGSLKFILLLFLNLSLSLSATHTHYLSLSLYFTNLFTSLSAPPTVSHLK